MALYPSHLTSNSQSSWLNGSFANVIAIGAISFGIGDLTAFKGFLDGDLFFTKRKTIRVIKCLPAKIKISDLNKEPFNTTIWRHTC
jgi:hypothetical protein